MKLTLNISGYTDIESSIKSIQRAMQGALTNIAMAGALPIEDEAKILAPVRTGTLRRSITSQITASSSTSATVSIGPTVDYGIYVEFGTRHMAAQPYMRPAFETKQAEALAAMSAVAKEIIQDAMVEEVNARASRRR